MDANNINLGAIDAQVNASFPKYMNELLRTSAEMPHQHGVGVPGHTVVRDVNTYDGAVNVPHENEEDAPMSTSPTNEKTKASNKRKRAADDDGAPASNKPKRPTSNLRKLQNKLSQQRFRQKKREVESNQQNELELMQKKIKELEVAKSELPELQTQNNSLEQALEVKEKEIRLLRKEIEQAKSERFKNTTESMACRIPEEIPVAIAGKAQNDCNIMKNRLLLATTHEYENTVNELRSIALSYPNGMPEDDDIEAQRRVAPVLYNFVDMTHADNASPCIRSLLAASLAYLSLHGLHPSMKDQISKCVRSLNLSNVQEMKVMAVRDKLMADLKLIYDERKELNQRIQNGFMQSGTTDSNGAVVPMQDDALKETSDALVSDVDELKANLLCECQLRQNYQVSFFRLLQPIQMLKIILASEPGFPDLIAFSNIIAMHVEEDTKSTISFMDPVTQS